MKPEELDPHYQHIVERVGEKIKALRKEKGISYVKLAEEIGIGKITYFKLEKGTNFTIKTLLLVLEYHGISLKEFFMNL